jgi:hypothetical protein
VAGPLWDFNLGFGNANYCAGGSTSGWEIDFNTICGGSLQNPFWWRRLLEDPSYANAVKCRWLELRQSNLSTEFLMSYIDSMALVLEIPAQRNYSKWPILGTYVWPNNFVGNTFQEEIDYLKTWISNRLIWMDNNMFGVCDNLSVNDLTVSNSFQVYPNPTSGVLNIINSEHQKKTTINLYTAYGGEVGSFEFIDQKEISLDLSSFSKGLYFLTIQQNNEAYQTFKIEIQ